MSTVKDHKTLSHLVLVQDVIDYFVLGELSRSGASSYPRELQQQLIELLDGIKVNDAYLNRRLEELVHRGHLTREWKEPNRRYYRMYSITPAGRTYFEAMQNDLNDRVQLAHRIYGHFLSYMKNFSG